MDDWMLAPDWKEEPGSNEWVSMEDVVNHIDHIYQLAGNAGHAAIGSDLDGDYGTEQTPGDPETVADLHKIADILRRRGYAEEGVEKIMYGASCRRRGPEVREKPSHGCTGAFCFA